MRLTDSSWEIAATPAGARRNVDDDSFGKLSWLTVKGVTTAAAALRTAGAWSDAVAGRRFDGEDWWFRTRFPRPTKADAGESDWLCFGGIATHAEIWLNEKPLLQTRNMFRNYEVDVSSLLAPYNDLVIVCRALDTELARKRPRPRWRAPMVENQQLRWFRTTLLGRTPGWSPPVASVGPWRPIDLIRRSPVRFDNVTCSASVSNSDGQLAVRATLASSQKRLSFRATVIVSRGSEQWRSDATLTDAGLRCDVTIPAVRRWWPHTHGEPALYDVRLEIHHDNHVITQHLPRVGFRTIELVTSDGDFYFIVNGVRIFARGAVWTPPDVIALGGTSDQYRVSIARACDAGMNMLRVPGTHTYESGDFYHACDAAGLLVWQDFMFANMDFPDGDPEFVAEVKIEVRQQLQRLASHPCIALWCGNSEVEQQAAMFGVERSRWQSPLFSETIAGLVAELALGTAYITSSATGGNFPHQSNHGPTSYYGVGAYLRTADDARRADVRFASECLAFANVPEAVNLAEMPGGLSLRCHHPLWKSRTPRDLGAGWDFEDVRDHYVKSLFAVDPMALRYSDHERYLAVSRVAPGEMLATTIAEWRRAGSRCGGAIVLMLRDLWAGAGWGLLDSAGRPKAAWYYARRAMAPRTVLLSDEGGNGVIAHLVNDNATATRGDLRVRLFRNGETVIADETKQIEVAGFSVRALDVAEMFSHFYDLSYSYRFGPSSYDVMHLQWSVDTVTHHGYFFPTGHSFPRRDDLGIKATLHRRAPGSAMLRLETLRFAQAVAVEIEGYRAVDNYVHIAPGQPLEMMLISESGEASDTQPNGPIRGGVTALNSLSTTKIELVLEDFV
jgi:beta-mannosidase